MILPHFDTPAHARCAAPRPFPKAWTEPDPDAGATSPLANYEAALRYIAAGLSVIPIDAETASKSPDNRRLPRVLDHDRNRSVPSWKPYQVFKATEADVFGWFDRGGPFGLAVVGGLVSGGGRGNGLEIIDFDSAELAVPWAERVERRCPGLLARLPQVQSPRPGRHVYYRCPVIGGNQKLAEVVEIGQGGRPKRKTVVETRGEGGYCLVPPSPPGCHPSGGLYRLLAGSPDLTEVPVITPDERSVLIGEARSFHEWPAEPTPVRRPNLLAPDDGNRPGDDFNRRGDWHQILVPFGWTCVGRYGEEERWRRPGKPDGLSATVNHAGIGRLNVFSSNADPFEAGGSYSKFEAYARLYHDGDFTAAAKALREKGFGGNTNTNTNTNNTTTN